MQRRNRRKGVRLGSLIAKRACSERKFHVSSRVRESRGNATLLKCLSKKWGSVPNCERATWLCKDCMRRESVEVAWESAMPQHQTALSRRGLSYMLLHFCSFWGPFLSSTQNCDKEREERARHISVPAPSYPRRILSASPLCSRN